MTHRTFPTTLAYGQLWEEKAQACIKELYGVEVIEEQTSDNYLTMHYDFKTSDGKTYEVKADRKSTQTGNFFIEYEGNNKPTGISITKAKTHILTDEAFFYVIRTRKIKELLKNNKYDEGYVYKSKTKGFLVPRPDMMQHAQLYPCR